ncbi:MAG: killer suppression protein [Bacteroidetes bacterium]|nr:killer suppression protein [Bacteroidota bacterium]
MDISFRTNKLQKQLTSDKKRRKTYGTECAKKLKRRLDDLHAATCLDDVRPPFPGRCHELKGDRQGVLAMDAKHPYRLLFEPAHDPIPTKNDGGLDWSEVTAITIIDVEDYHG